MCGCAVVACILVVTLRQQRPDIAVVLAAAAGVVLFFMIAAPLRQAAEGILELLEAVPGGTGELRVVLRALGVCLTAQLGADLCRDCGQASLAAKVELGGKAAVLVLLLPLLAEIVGIAGEIMG